MRDVAVIGVGMNRWGELWAKSHRTIWTEAALEAVDDAGLDRIDAMCRQAGVPWLLVLIPDENARDLTEIPKNIKKDLDIRPVKWIDEVLQEALQHQPVPLADEGKEAAERKAVKNKEKGRQKPVTAH